jgi:type III restriction enzyme
VPPVSIENPILNSSFAEPTRYFKFDDDGITSEIAEGRQRSTYFSPIAKTKVKGGAQLTLPGGWVGERMNELPKELEHLLQSSHPVGVHKQPASVTL